MLRLPHDRDPPGRGDAGAARTVGRRAIAWGLVAGCLFGGMLLALATVLPQAFTASASTSRSRCRRSPWTGA